MPADATTQARPTADLPPAAPYGHYQLLRQAGQGGMGIVYQAYDAALQRPVALKVLQLQRQGQFHQQQLLEEARVASSLQHPNIVTVYDISRTEQQSYIVTEWLEGQTLDHYLQRPLSLPDKLHLLQQIAAGLASAHQAGVIHRDLKPSNLMVCLPAQQVKILDFGMASRQRRLQQQAETEGAGLPPMLSSQLNTQWSQHTTAHQIKGTLPYMAPELLQSDVDATIQSDVFAFGVIMYELCHGVHPFLRENADATMQAIVQQIKQTPGQPAVLPQSLKNLIDQCLALHPSQRPADLSKVAGLLAKLQQELLQRQRLGIWYPLVRWQFWAAMAPIILVFSLWLGQQSVDKQSLLSQGKTLALQPFDNLGGDPAVQQFLQGMALSLSQDLAKIGQHNQQVWVLPPGELANLKEPSLKNIYQQYQTDLIISGTLQHLGATRRLSLNLHNGADGRILKSSELDLPLNGWDQAQQQVRQELLQLLNWQQPSDLTLSKGSATSDEVYKAYLTGLSYLYRFDYKDNIEKSVQALQQAVGSEPNFEQAHYALAAAYLRLARQPDSIGWLVKAEQMLSQPSLLSQKDNVQWLALNAEINLVKSEYNKAVELYLQVLSRTPTNAESLMGIASSYQRLGKNDLAEKYLLQLVTLYDHWYFKDALALFYYESSQLDKALTAYKDLLANSPNNSRILQTIGAIQFSLVDYDSARRTFEKALQVDANSSNYANLATVYFYQKNYQEAVTYFQKAVELKPERYLLWGNLADSYRWTQQTQKAQNAYTMALQLLENRLVKAPNRPALKLQKAIFLAKLGQSSAALEQLPALTTPKMKIAAAQVYELSGFREKALGLIEQAVSEGYQIAAIRAEPEFQSLIQTDGHRISLLQN